MMKEKHWKNHGNIIIILGIALCAIENLIVIFGILLYSVMCTSCHLIAEYPDCF